MLPKTSMGVKRGKLILNCPALTGTRERSIGRPTASTGATYRPRAIDRNMNLILIDGHHFSIVDREREPTLL